MEFVEGTTLHGVSRFCFGCEQLGGVDWGIVDTDEVKSAIQLAVDFGVNFFDTAAVYGLGQSETRLSEALGQGRHDVTIATKGGLSVAQSSDIGRATISRDASGEALRASVQASLERLKIDCLPVFFVHWPDPATPIGELMDTLLSLKQSGKIRNIGLSNFDCRQIGAAQKFGNVDVVQVTFSLLSRDSRSIIEMCRNQIIPVCANCCPSACSLRDRRINNAVAPEFLIQLKHRISDVPRGPKPLTNSEDRRVVLE